MYEQLSIFDFIGEKKFCFDDDINYIVDQLDMIVAKIGCECTKKTFTIWSHVPQYGYRLDYSICVRKDMMPDLITALEKVVKEAESRDVELSPMWGALWFMNEDYGNLYCFSTFMDSKRRKIK